MALNNFQKKALLLIGAFFAIDNLITIYGVFFYGPGFYEANPIYQHFIKISPWAFLGAVTVLKLSALGALALMAHALNTMKDPVRPVFPASWYNGKKWGNLFCSFAALAEGSALAYLTYINIA